MIVLAAGGTGGHMFPAEAVAHALAAKGRALTLITDTRGAAYTKAWPEHRAVILPIRNPGGGAKAALPFAMSALRSIPPALRALRGAEAVLCFGGYPTLPAGLLAALLGVPLLVHEQNALMGRTNRLLARYADAAALSFIDTVKVPKQAARVFTGNPVRPGIMLAAQSPYPPADSGTLEILVLGGSQGAKILADYVPAAIAALSDNLRSRVRVVQQARADDVAGVTAAYASAGIPAEVNSFFDDMPARYTAAQLVIARSGASTCAELTTIGRPALFIPFAAAAEDHQTRNAEALARQGAAWIAAETEVRSGALSEKLAALLSDPKGLHHAAAAAAGLIGYQPVQKVLAALNLS